MRLSGRGAAAKMFGFPATATVDGDPDAEFVFYSEHFTADSIAHEVLHGLIYVFRKAGRDPMADSYDEELFAILQGKMTQAILDWKAEVQQ